MTDPFLPRRYLSFANIAPEGALGDHHQPSLPIVTLGDIMQQMNIRCQR